MLKHFYVASLGFESAEYLQTGRLLQWWNLPAVTGVWHGANKKRELLAYMERWYYYHSVKH